MSSNNFLIWKKMYLAGWYLNLEPLVLIASDLPIEIFGR